MASHGHLYRHGQTSDRHRTKQISNAEGIRLNLNLASHSYTQPGQNPPMDPSEAHGPKKPDETPPTPIFPHDESRESTTKSSLHTHKLHGRTSKRRHGPERAPVRRQRRLGHNRLRITIILVRVTEERFSLRTMSSDLPRRRDVVPGPVGGAARR